MPAKQQYWKEKNAKVVSDVVTRLDALLADKPNDIIAPYLMSLATSPCDVEGYTELTWLEAILRNQMRLALGNNNVAVRAFEAIANRIAGKPTEYRNVQANETISMLVRQIEPNIKIVDAPPFPKVNGISELPASNEQASQDAHTT